MNIINKHRVLVAPLDWGLGHATRCIPLIHGLHTLGFEVLLAGEGAIASVLKNEFPDLKMIPLKGYQVHYARTRWGTVLSILIQIPKMVRRIRQEHLWLQRTIATHRIDLVISDNRFGLYSDFVPCVFITHQLTIKAGHGFVEYLMQRIQYRWIEKFRACWIPDNRMVPNLGGELSHPSALPKIPVHYMGLISRMQAHQTIIRYRYCFLLSGPEPQRSILESIILDALPAIKDQVLLVRGLPADPNTLIPVSENVTIYNHLEAAALQDAINASELIICRGGYTSLMDLIGLQKKALLIPTPGQTEQEYLAARLQASGIFYSRQQKQLDVLQDMDAAEKWQPSFSDYPFFTINRLEALLAEL